MWALLPSPNLGMFHIGIVVLNYHNHVTWLTDKNSALGEARTHNLRISHNATTAWAELYTDYKYGALTDCATGAPANSETEQMQ